jgi:RNA polymerase sigma-70 factor (ECF subfamily)
MTARLLESTVSEADELSFVRARPGLVRIARRVLGNPADADDVVQDAWMRWQETDRSKVRDPAAFLATTTTRLALNIGQSARARRETYDGRGLLEATDPAADPALGAEQSEALERALRPVLERLSPTERAAYILREAFEYPHRRIAQVLGLSEANVRQIITRARRRIPGDGRRQVAAGEFERLLDAFLAAAGTGDLAGLERLLAGGSSRATRRLARRAAAPRPALCAS